MKSKDSRPNRLAKVFNRPVHIGSDISPMRVVSKVNLHDTSLADLHLKDDYDEDFVND